MGKIELGSWEVEVEYANIVVKDLDTKQVKKVSTRKRDTQ
jgi:hypothetical protein